MASLDDIDLMECVIKYPKIAKELNTLVTKWCKEKFGRNQTDVIHTELTNLIKEHIVEIRNEKIDVILNTGFTISTFS